MLTNFESRHEIFDIFLKLLIDPLFLKVVSKILVKTSLLLNRIDILKYPLYEKQGHRLKPYGNKPITNLDTYYF